MANQKTTETAASVATFVKTVDPSRQADCKSLVQIMESETGYPAKMWGPSIIGFGSYHYVYESGHEGDAPLVGFSPRKNEFALYLANFDGKEALLEKMGKHKVAKSCVYLKKLEDADEKVLRKIIKSALQYMKKKYPQHS